jgi:5'-nucleotidase
MHILLTNDDGISAPGIRALYAALSRRFRVSVVAPASEQSGIGHAFTFNTLLRCEPVTFEATAQGWAVAGTPSDCVKVALSNILELKPDVVISGMNIGENSGISAYYSGTVAGAREGAFWGLASMAFSVCQEGGPYLEEWCERAAGMVDAVVALHRSCQQQGSTTTFYNINFPACAPQHNRGIRVTRQSLAYFDDRYKAVEDGQGGTGYRIYGEKKELELSDGYDSRALLNDFTTVTPLHFDATAQEALAHFRQLEREEGEKK